LKDPSDNLWVTTDFYAKKNHQIKVKGFFRNETEIKIHSIGGWLKMNECFSFSFSSSMSLFSSKSKWEIFQKFPLLLTFVFN
jgi:hypothetical protein